MTKSVSSALKKQYNAVAFFAGVGGIELGFKQTGEFRVVYANEFDKNACKTYLLNNPKILLDDRDIHQVDVTEVPSADIIMAGFPCQAFSIAGYRKGFEDERGDLFFELLRMINAKRPRVVFIENVKNLVTHDHGNTFKVIREALVENGYYIKWRVLNGKDYGNVPQNRERIYVVGYRNKEDFDSFEFPQPVKLTRTLRDVIDFRDKKNEKYYYREGKQPFYEKLVESITSQSSIYQWRRQYVRENKSGVVPTLTANMGTGGHNVPLILTDSGEIRKLTPKETFNIQGYPDKFKLPEDETNGQLYKQAGNSVVVPVIYRIAKKICCAIDNKADAKEKNEQKKYALIYSKIESRFSGLSYVQMFANNKGDIRKCINRNSIPVLSDEDYLKVVQKKSKAEFYMIEEC